MPGTGTFTSFPGPSFEFSSASPSAYSGATIVSFPAAPDVLSANWAEHVENWGPSQSSWQWNDSHAVLVGDIDFLNIPAAVLQFLGFSQQVTGTSQLHRQLPLCHPAFPWMYATKIPSVEPFAPYTAAVASTTNPEANTLPYFTGYRGARMTVQFEALDYVLMTDSTLAAAPYNGNELYRYVSRHFKGAFETLLLDRGQMKFAETPPGPVAVGSGLAKVLQAAEPTLIWRQVPERGLFDSTLVPQNILDCVGMVNEAEFLGYPPGTLLCLPPDFTPSMYPVSPSYWTGFPTHFPARMFDVTFRFKWFDPPRTNPDLLDPNTGQVCNRGHNLVPWTLNFNWFLISTDGTLNGKRLYDPADFTKLFRMNTG